MDPMVRQLMDQTFLPGLDEEEIKVLKLIKNANDNDGDFLLRMQGRIQGIEQARHALKKMTGYSAQPGGTA